MVIVPHAVPAPAATTTERSASILIFPKVIFDGSRDTLIQISNTSNSMTHALCFYVNAAPECIGFGDCLAGTCNGRCEPRWIEIDFSIWLTKQQPTHWSVGSGRFTDLSDLPCDPDNYDCDGAGLDPGRIPPANSVPFTGELRCIEVDQSGAPISGNHLKGEATIVSSDGDASSYNAVGLLGLPFTNNGDNILCLGGGVSDECPSGAEYEGCGERVIMDHFAERADNPLFGPTSTVRTEVTLVPCAIDYEHQRPTNVVTQFLTFNEFESRFSSSTPFNCWATFLLSQANSVFDIRALQTRFAQTFMRPSDMTDSGITGVWEEYHLLPQAAPPPQQTRAAFNFIEQGTRRRTDIIFLPEGP